jgi:hypothetical protein
MKYHHRMSKTIEVTVTERPAQGGREIIVQSKSGPMQQWKKWYSDEWAPGSELSLLGLTDDGMPTAQGKRLTINRKLKNEATLDPDELLRYGFRHY